MDSVKNRIPSTVDAGMNAREAAREAALAGAVAQVEAHLAGVSAPLAQPVLVLLSGLPGSGKTYLARRLQPHLSATIVETDYVRHILFPHPRYTGPENGWVYMVCHALIARLLERSQAVIFDATNLMEGKREILYHIADRGQARLIVVHTVAPEEVIHERLASRSGRADPANHSDADIAVYHKLRETEQPIRRQHLVIDTTQDSDEAILRILRECRV